MATHAIGHQMPKPTVVLVVEDEVLLRMDIVDQFERLGFNVYEAGNAEEAIELLLQHSEIEVLVTDVDMPGAMDGLMLAAAVRDRWPPIKIIVTSGHRNVRLSDMPNDSRFFGKPYAANAIALAVREMSGRHD